MNVKNIRLISIVRTMVLIVIFYLAIVYENASGIRMNILIGLFLVLISIGIVRVLFRENELLYNYSYILDIALIYFMEHNSRFLINYFFHSFYIVVLLEASMLLDRKRSLIVGIITVATSLIKYFLLIFYKNNFANLSEIVFFILINSLILVISNFAQYYREERERKDLLYDELMNTHRKLKEYANRVHELTKIEERNRIARDIHDTLGHNMTALIMQIEMSEHIMQEDLNSAKEILDEAKETARDGLVKIREVVDTLRDDGLEVLGIESIKELVKDFREKTKLDIDIHIQGEIPGNNPLIYAALYRVIQESLTNSVRHGKATKIEITLSFASSRIEFMIGNNGLGVDCLKEGFGIKGMRERVEYLGGRIEFEGVEGFKVKGYIPMGVKL